MLSSIPETTMSCVCIQLWLVNVNSLGEATTCGSVRPAMYVNSCAAGCIHCNLRNGRAQHKGWRANAHRRRRRHEDGDFRRGPTRHKLRVHECSDVKTHGLIHAGAREKECSPQNMVVQDPRRPLLLRRHDGGTDLTNDHNQTGCARVVAALVNTHVQCHVGQRTAAKRNGYAHPVRRQRLRDLMEKFSSITGPSARGHNHPSSLMPYIRCIQPRLRDGQSHICHSRDRRAQNQNWSHR
jgi:hypothetical protein